MNCEELQRHISLYLDNCLSPAARALCDEHLAECPVCRAELQVSRRIARQLAAQTSTLAPAELAHSINARINTERIALKQIERESPIDIVENIRHRFAARLMPFTVGAFATLLLFVSLIGTLRPNFFTSSIIEGVLAIENAAPEIKSGYDITKPVTPETYVASRAPFTVDSPSLNPKAALATANWNGTRTADSANTSDDEMMIVADVFSDGKASLVEVINAPRNRQMLNEFEDALRREAVFVPAAMDERPRTMRVVYMIQKVEVRDKPDVPHS